MNNLAASFFSLIKTNGGLFKSEKQARFLLSHCVEGVYTSKQSFHFGEYEGRTNRNTAYVTFSFLCDSEGVKLVQKETRKGSSIYWEYSAEGVEKARSNETKRQQLRNEIKAIEAEINLLSEPMRQLQENYRVLQPVAEALPDNEDFQRIVSNLAANIKAIMNLNYDQQTKIDKLACEIKAL